MPLHGVGEREALGVSADRDQLVGAELRGLDAVDRTAQHNRMPARRLAAASLGNGMVSP